MAGETTRVRLVFEDRRILSKSQRKQGLNRSWVIVNTQEHPTISDFSSHLLHNFDLYDACPNGIFLSMDGFVLPSFESTSLLKDKDIVSVKRKGSSSSDIVKVDDEIDAFELVDLPERQHVIPDLKFLAAEEFQKEVGGYESESEEDELQQMEDSLFVECTPPRKSSSNKRKPTSKSHSRKKKKRKLGSVEEKSKKHVKNALGSKKKKTCGSDVDEKKTPPKKKQASNRPSERDKTCVITRADEKSADRCVSSTSPSLQENSKGTGDLSQMSGETKKTISRSARRKKVKRQWLREKARLEKEEVLQKQLVLEDKKHSLNSNAEEHQNHVNEIHDAVEEQEDDTGDDIVPVEIRPGHIRFEPLGKAGEDPPLCENESPVVTNTNQWNGITSKKKGQKWGTQKTAYSKWNESNNQNFSEDIPQTQTANGHLDYEKLMPYLGLPKAGDIIAYRLIELSSSWTPEISSFRVGKISRYNADSKKVMLMPVPEYPLETKVDEDDSSPQPNTSLYNEDGTLEIEYSSLLDIRDVKSSTSNIARRITTEVAEESVPERTQKFTSPNQNNNLELHSHPAKANGSANVWEEISQALSLKKEELSQKNGWVKKENATGRGSWSYKALRGSALGPTMDYLRSQKEL